MGTEGAKAGTLIGEASGQSAEWHLFPNCGLYFSISAEPSSITHPGESMSTATITPANKARTTWAEAARSLRSAPAVLVLALAGVVVARGRGDLASEAGTVEPAVLTSAAQVRGLSETEAARSLPVRLRGVVVGDAPPVGRAFILWDKSEYLYVRADSVADGVFRRGDYVEIEGYSGAGGFAPLTFMTAGRRVSEGVLPAPRELSAEQLLAGQFDSYWVRVRGIVRQCEPASAWAGRWRLTLAVGGQLVAVFVDGEQSPESLVDAEVTVDGLFFNQHNMSRQFVRAQLFVPNGVSITTTVAAPSDPYAAPVRPVRSLLQFERNARVGHRVHVRGMVLHQAECGWLWVRDGDHAVRVLSRQGAPVVPGDSVDVVGFPTLGGYTPRIENAIFRKCADGIPPAPVEPPDLHAAIAHDSDLIALEGRLVEARRTAEGVTLLLDWRGTLVPTLLELSAKQTVPDDWVAGSFVRATGLCAVPLNEAAPATGLLEPRAIELHLRSTSDLAVLQPPPWWNRKRIFWGLGVATAVSVLAATGVFLSARRRLRDQALRREKAEAEFSAILAERNRVAREIHDTLAQGLAAVSMQLELAKNAPDGGRTAVAPYLEAAHGLVRENLAEARAAIWNMRSQALETHDLAGALEGVLRQLTTGRQAATEFRVSGSRRRLAPQTENEILRIGQEAITNAAKHATARRIEVSLN